MKLRELRVNIHNLRQPDVDASSNLPFDEEKRDRVLQLWEDGCGMSGVAETLDVPDSTACDWIHRFQQTGQKAPLRRGGVSNHVIDEDMAEAILDYFEKHNAATLEQYEAHLGSKYASASPAGRIPKMSTISSFLHKNGILLKMASVICPQQYEKSAKSLLRSDMNMTFGIPNYP
eukprot:ANDGO_02205.mRNA.1 hypothetical protein